MSGPDGFPLALAQEEIWVSEQVIDTASLFSAAAVFALRGDLDLVSLRTALTTILDRHPVLRGVVSSGAGSPRLVTAGSSTVQMEPVDVGSEQELTDRLTEATAVPFDLSRGPLARFGLYRLEPAEHRLLVDVHHLVFDGVSAQLLAEELAELLDAAAGGREPRLPELTLTYQEYAVRQRRALADGLLDSDIEYWCARLGDAPVLLGLPTDHPRPPHQSFRGTTHTFTLPAELRERTAAAACEWSCTPFVVLLAGWAAVLARYSGQEDLLVGTPVAGRTEPGTEDMIGMFVNTLVLRMRPGRAQTFRGLVDRTLRDMFEGLAYQEAPVAEVVRRLGRGPLFQTVFGYNEASGEPLRAGKLTIEDATPPPRTTARNDLIVEVTERGDWLEVEIEYAADHFEPETVNRLATHYATFLDNALRRPDLPLHRIQMLSPGERDMLLKECDARPHELLPTLFEAQAARSPDARAVSWGDEQWSYDELNQKANRLAAALVAGPEDVVAVAVPSGPLFALAAVAIIKAGAAFLPIDPAYPVKRIEYVLADARPALVLTDSAGAEAHAWPVPVLILDDYSGDVDQRVENPSRPLELDHPAYVLYTSGSTGTPKGVVVTHRGLAGLAGSQIEAFGVRPGSRVLQFASPSFDASVSELCMALLSGATVVFVPDLHNFADGSLEDVLIRESVTHVTLPPSALATLSPGGKLPADLTIVAAGEKLPVDLAARWAGRLRLFNAYGPTEATVAATTAGPLAPGEFPSIGRPNAGVRVLVLDEDLQPVPVGVVGELYLAGPGLARGYRGLPGRTAVSFVACPFGPPGARLYRTGDRGRWRADGNLEFVGRQDDQVKLNGFRIELGEIENVLGAHPAVDQAAVVVRESRAGARQLVAFLVAHAPDEDILTFASSRLPRHMMPSALVRLASMPRTAHGKVDRLGLPAPERPAPAADRPLTGREQQLRMLFSEVLELETVGVDESFFEIGGNSLLAVHLLSRIRAAFGVEVGLRPLFEAPTVAALAVRFEAGAFGATTRPVLGPARG